MSRKIIGVTVGTPLSIRAIKDKLNPVTQVNGATPDENGNVEIEAGGGTSSWNDLTDKPFGAATTEWKQIASYTGATSLSSTTNVTIPGLTLSVETGRKYRIVFKEINYDYIYIESTVIAITTTGAAGQYISLGTNEDDIYGYQLRAGMPWSFVFKKSRDFLNGYELVLYEVVESLTTLDEKYIPDTIARTEDVQSLISEAILGAIGGSY